MHAAIEHRDKRFRDHGPDAGESLGDGVGPQREHRARRVFAKRRADAARVTAHQIELELADFVARDTRRSHLAEAGVHAVYRGAGLNQPLDHGAGRVHSFARRRWNFRFGAVEGDAVEVLQRQALAVDGDAAHVFTPVPITISSGMVMTLPSESFRKPAKISASALARVSGVSFAISGRNGAATSVNCCQ